MKIILLFLVCWCCAIRCGSPTDGNYSASANWGASTAQTYDFIIMGAGAAGSVLAAKLSENANVSVLLLEAGGASHRDTGGTDYVMNSFTIDPVTQEYVLGVPFTRFDVPSFASTITDPVLFTKYNWNITGTSAGKTLGGSMGHNGMVWVHPTPANVATWGVSGWNYTDFIPWVQAVENYTASGFPSEPTLGYSGAIHIQKSTAILPAEMVFYNICTSIGIPACENMNAPAGPNGICPISFNIGSNGVRQSSAQSYLAPAMARSNLVVSLFSQGARVLFTAATLTSKANATGITYVQTLTNGTKVKRTAYASKEVILSGGGLNSPKTLMLSGIGPRSQLTQFNISAVVFNENVGRNMRNHYLGVMEFQANNVTFPNFQNLPTQVIQYGTLGTGMYTFSPQIGAYWTQVKSSPSLVDPDALFTVGYVTDTLYDKYVQILIGTSAPSYKNGTVTLASANPLDELIFTSNSNPPNTQDTNSLVAAINKVRQIFNTPLGSSYFGAEIVPGASITGQNLTNYVAANSFLAFHYFGSTKMGNISDPLAVVDPRFRVIGVNNLRVVDCGTIPGLVNSAIQATTAAFGLRGASMILADHNLPY